MSTTGEDGRYDGLQTINLSALGPRAEPFRDACLHLAGLPRRLTRLGHETSRPKLFRQKFTVRQARAPHDRLGTPYNSLSLTESYERLLLVLSENFIRPEFTGEAESLHHQV
jgi:hypothetical protein